MTTIVFNLITKMVNEIMFLFETKQFHWNSVVIERNLISIIAIQSNNNICTVYLTRTYYIDAQHDVLYTSRSV